MRSEINTNYDGMGFILFWAIILIIAGVIAFTTGEILDYPKQSHLQQFKIRKADKERDRLIQVKQVRSNGVSLVWDCFR